MKKLFTLLLGFIPMLLQAQFKAKSFMLSSSKVQEEEMVLTVTKDTAVSIAVKQPISGISISGEAHLFDETSFIRVLLRDHHDIDYLIYEDYYPLSEVGVYMFTETAMETVVLNQVTPQSLVIEIKNAELKINGLHYTDERLTEGQYAKRAYSTQTDQLDYIIEQMNVNLRKEGKLWRARKTELSQMTYDEKKAKFGGSVPKFYGFEYYGGGIFVMPDTDLSPVPTSGNSINQYVSEWDWRNRHGKNWMTPAKDQLMCMSCGIFSALGVLEAYANLYFNQNIDFDLSEQELVSCADLGGCGGGFSLWPVTQIKKHGVICEECFPYQGIEAPCEEKCAAPSERVFVEDSEYLSSNIYTREDSIKQLIFNAPIQVSVFFEGQPMGHAIVLCGYKALSAGDSITFLNFGTEEIVVPENSELIGKTAWLVKNSWGTSWGDEGYAYFITNKSNLSLPCRLKGKVLSNFYNDSHILCKDEDGDGYYTWGVGERPESVPEWAPEQQDGDDSDYSKGPINRYGFLEELNPDGKDTLYVKLDSVIQKESYLHNHMAINSGASLTIKKDMTFYKGAKILVKKGGKLIVDGCLLKDATILCEKGGKLEIINDGKITPVSGGTFSVPKGAYMRINAGSIS